MKTFAKYFKPGQKILLRLLDRPDSHYEALSVSFVEFGATGGMTLSLPYNSHAGEEFPFLSDMPLELSTESLGLGIRVRCRFSGYSSDRRAIQVENDGELQIFQRRSQRRIDTDAGLRFTRGQGTLRTFRDQWRKNSEILDQTDPATLPAFPATRINLSTTGLRVAFKTPVDRADLCLILLQLQQSEKPVCALAEVVWTGKSDEEGRIPAGMQFIAIREQDRKTIDRYIRQHQTD